MWPLPPAWEGSIPSCSRRENELIGLMGRIDSEKMSSRNRLAGARFQVRLESPCLARVVEPHDHHELPWPEVRGMTRVPCVVSGQASLHVTSDAGVDPEWILQAAEQISVLHILVCRGAAPLRSVSVSIDQNLLELLGTPWTLLAPPCATRWAGRSMPSACGTPECITGEDGWPPRP
jgi:hypothetical protein